MEGLCQLRFLNLETSLFQGVVACCGIPATLSGNLMGAGEREVGLPVSRQPQPSLRADKRGSIRQLLGSRALCPIMGGAVLTIAGSNPVARFKINSLLQGSQRYRNDLMWILTELTVEARVVVGIHAALEHHGIQRPIKEPRRNTQRTDLITGSPCLPDLLCFGFQDHRPIAYAVI
jgi:hypothetical protein